MAVAPITTEAGSGTLIVPSISWHAGELFPRVGFVVTNLRRSPKRVVKFYNGRGMAEQWIKEGKNALSGRGCRAAGSRTTRCGSSCSPWPTTGKSRVTVWLLHPAPRRVTLGGRGNWKASHRHDRIQYSKEESDVDTTVHRGAGGDAGLGSLGDDHWGRPEHAGSLSVGPTSEGSRRVQEFPPPGSETLVGEVFPGSLLNSQDGRVGVVQDSAFEFGIASISTIPQGAVVTSATFSLNIAGAQTVINQPTLDVSGYADADGVVGLDDFHKPTTFIGNTGVLPNSAGPTSLNIPFDFNATNFIQSLVNDRTPFAGFRLDVEGTSNVNVWDSLAPDPAQRPRLEVTFSFRRARAPGRRLMGLGIVGLLAVAWRRGLLAVASRIHGAMGRPRPRGDRTAGPP